MPRRFAPYILLQQSFPLVHLQSLLWLQQSIPGVHLGHRSATPSLFPVEKGDGDNDGDGKDDGDDVEKR